MKNNLIICLITVIFNYSAFSQNISNDEKQNILKSRGYASLGNETNGLIRITKLVPRVLTVKDIESSKKYWGTNAENDTRYLTKDIGTKVNSRKFGYISSSTLIEVIPAVYDKFDDEFVNSMLLAKRDEKYMLLKKDGDSIETKELINYNYIDFNNCGSFENCYIEREGYRKVKSINGKWGFVDNNWNIVIPCIYDSANNFEDGHCAVVQSGIQGIINKKGNFKPVLKGIIIGEFGHDGIAEFTYKNKKGVIDTNGKILIPAKYTSILIDYNKGISAKIDNKWIDLDRNGNIILPEKKEIIKKEVVETKLNNNGKSTPTSYSNENQECETTISEYEKFAKEFIKYSNSAKAGTVKFNINEYVKWEKEIRKQNDNVMKCVTDSNRLRVLKTMEKVLVAVQSTYGNSGSTSSSSSSSTASNNSGANNSKQSKSHTYKVIISWNNPVATNSHQAPSAQNGTVEYFSERSGSFQVKPICPICSKKQYNTISGFAAGKDSKIVTINCN